MYVCAEHVRTETNQTKYAEAGAGEQRQLYLNMSPFLEKNVGLNDARNQNDGKGEQPNDLHQSKDGRNKKKKFHVTRRITGAG